VSYIPPVLPTTLEEITAPWLTDALATGAPGTVVSSVSIDEPIWGTATKVFLRVEYERRATEGPPEMLCLKGGFNDEMRAVAGLGYRVESMFYRDIAPSFEPSVPHSWYAADDPDGNQGLVLTDDLRTDGADFGSPMRTYSLDQVAAALESLARWHGTTWDRADLGKLAWLSVGSQLFRPVVDGFMMPAHWQDYMTRRQTAAFTDELRDRDRVEAAVHKQWVHDDADALSVSHGDPHPGNTYILDDGAIRFLDWQTTCLAPWSDDLAYFLVGILDVEQRRAHETELLRHYLGALASTGAPAPTFDDAWLAYRRHHLHGLMFALCPPEMQVAEVCALMGDRYAAAAIDHDTLSAVES
jgi:Ecdysteroid kinase-like family